MSSTHSTMSETWPDDLYLVIPAYKAADTLQVFLPGLLRRVPAAQVIVVDDGSRDRSAAVCGHTGVTCLVLPRNRGKGAALRRGFTEARCRGARWIMTMDADGQHALEDIDGFLAALQANPSAGIIIGRRDRRPGCMPLPRIISNTLTSAFLGLVCGCPIQDSQCGYRIYAAHVLDAIPLDCDRFEMESEVILKACRQGFTVEFIPVQTLYLGKGSHIAHVADTFRWIWAVIKTWYSFTRSSRSHGLRNR